MMSHDAPARRERRAVYVITTRERAGSCPFAKRAQLLWIWRHVFSKNGAISEQMVDEKIQCIEQVEADYLIGADCGCLMNIGGRIERKGKPIRVMHIAEVLNSR